jgi:hypothetical protein
MTTFEMVTIGFGFVAGGWTMIRWGNSMNQRITENATEIVNIKRELEEHKTSNNNSFDNVAKVLDRWVQLSDSVTKNSERICNIRHEMDEHKTTNDKSFEVVMNALREIKSDNKEEHKEMFRLVGEGQNKLTDLLINKQN